VSDFPTHLVRAVRHPAIGASEKAVLYSLVDRMQSSTDAAWPSMATLADDSGMHERTCQRVIKSFLRWGVIVEVMDTTRRTRTFRVDFERLSTLPAEVAHCHPTQTIRHPTDCHPRATDGHPTPVRLPPKGDMVPPEGSKKDQEKKSEKTTADVPSRVLISFERPIELPFGSTIAATTAKPKATNRAGPKRRFTDEQIAARDTVYKFWKTTYFDEFKVEPIVGNAEVGQMVNLLKKLNWDADAACVLIANAFTYAFFRERIKTIGHILGNASAFQFPASAQAESRKPTARMSTMQSEPDLWADHEEQLATEHG
jgi:hypothetical protein